MAVNGVDGVTVTLGVQIPGLHVKFMPSTVTRHADMPITR
jgi:hypothetical protein